MRGCKSKVKNFQKTPQNGDFSSFGYCILLRVGTSFFYSPFKHLTMENIHAEFNNTKHQTKRHSVV